MSDVLSVVGVMLPPTYTLPLAVMLVVEAPPFMEKRPDVMVDDAVEMKPAKVERPLTPRVEESVAAPEAASVPTLAACENKLVELAVVLKKFVDVAFASVVLPVTLSVEFVTVPKFAFVEKIGRAHV